MSEPSPTPASQIVDAQHKIAEGVRGIKSQNARLSSQELAAIVDPLKEMLGEEGWAQFVSYVQPRTRTFGFGSGNGSGGVGI